MTTSNYQLYELVTAGTPPVLLADMKKYLGITNTMSDVLIDELINTCTAWGQDYTAREFTDNTYTLKLDEFDTRLCVRRNPIATITSIKYVVSAALVTVASTVYYLKKGVQQSEILLMPDQSWPTDGDDIEQGIVIEFITEAINANKLAMAVSAIKRHVAWMFENRGDCAEDAAERSGAESIYNNFRIARV